MSKIETLKQLSNRPIALFRIHRRH